LVACEHCFEHPLIAGDEAEIDLAGKGSNDEGGADVVGEARDVFEPIGVYWQARGGDEGRGAKDEEAGRDVAHNREQQYPVQYTDETMPGSDRQKAAKLTHDARASADAVPDAIDQAGQ